MLDIQFIRENTKKVKDAAAAKNVAVDIDKLLELDFKRRELLQEVEKLRKARNETAAQMKNGEPSPELIAEGRRIKETLGELESELAPTEVEYLSVLKAVPNIALDDVPIGKTEEENVVSKTIGKPAEFSFKPKNHAQIAESKGWMDKERAAKVSGSRFTYLKGDLVQLQFAIIQFVMSKLSDQTFLDEIIAENDLKVTNKPFVPVLPPFMLRTDLYDAMDRLEPRDDRYKIEDEDLWLQGSAEHVLGSMHVDETFAEADLPVRYIGYATSFRREAGTYGKDMEGMFRMHQFDKLEMESLTTAANGLQEHLFLIAIQEKIMQLLEIPYQVLTKCTADIGKPNARGVDIEAWLPGQGKYRETHTADYMTDYQARRLKTRVKLADGATELVHTNDATALPLSRGPIAIIENFQTEEGDVIIPEVLRPFMGGKERI
ncbi:MAG: serine--tRNA ligase [Candidatus Saccharimonadales bacterium]